MLAQPFKRLEAAYLHRQSCLLLTILNTNYLLLTVYLHIKPLLEQLKHLICRLIYVPTAFFFIAKYVSFLISACS